jgi:hypothetical protein
MSILVMVLKILVLLGALVATWFGGMLLFFYEKFAVFNELVNGQYMVGREKYGDGAGYKMDKWVLGWHSVLAILCLLIAAWLYWTFYLFLSL